jgi:hypothetical protein
LATTTQTFYLRAGGGCLHFGDLLPGSLLVLVTEQLRNTFWTTNSLVLGTLIYYILRYKNLYFKKDFPIESAYLEQDLEQFPLIYEAES